MHCCKGKQKVKHKLLENKIFSATELPTQGGIVLLFSKYSDNQKLKNIYNNINGHFMILTLDINYVTIVLCN